MLGELGMEQKLINQLVHGESQWTLREDIKTVDQLWDNFFVILENNNQDQLNNHPLTDAEKKIIKTQIVQPTFYKAAESMVGANRKVHYHLRREDSSLDDANLLIIDNTHISGGKSVYEVVHQIQMPRKTSLNHDRRLDVSLLINGLPFIHIELKRPGQPFQQAFNQIQKYINEGQFSDIYSFVQMFVVTNGTMTRYFAANEQLNAKFMSKWVNSNNQPVEDYLDFTKQVLSIPAAHYMIADYTVLDSQAEHIILLRPYQIHAIEEIRKAAQGDAQSGYIWHTTGSGKTLTSYKVARNLLQIPSIDKSVFLIDRKDLNEQTSTAFQTYANNDTIDVNETDNSYDLARKFTDGKQTVIVTTRQKIQTMFKRINDDLAKHEKYANKLRGLRIAFIVDECHRTITPKHKRELDRFFSKKPLWYGFTGTPIFAENARQENGQDARTTEELFGKCLHNYTIQNAIADQAVLGFQTNNLGYDDVDIDESNTKQLDAVYLTQEHMESVVKKVLKLAYKAQGIQQGERYSALFTTSSIKQAQRYYKLFKQVVDGTHPTITIPNRIVERYPDFPKIAVTYSVSENEENSTDIQETMREAIADYNESFDTKYDLSQIDGYNRNVSERLARKKKQYQKNGQMLDLVIVVDRMLTGFDAPSLSTIYIDRRPMNPQTIIQAFSRTNRIFNDHKEYGQIRTFQYPKTFKEAIDHALNMYSNGADLQTIKAPSWEESRSRFVKAEHKIVDYFSDNGEWIINADEDDRRIFIKEFQDFDHSYSAIHTYDELDDPRTPVDKQLDLSSYTPERLEMMQGIYEQVRQSLKSNKNDQVELLDLDYELESFHKEEINIQYILNLIQKAVGVDNYKSNDDTDKIDEFITRLRKTNQKLAVMMEQIWSQVKTDPSQYQNRSIEDVLDDLIDQELSVLMTDFSSKYHMDIEDLKYLIQNFDVSKGIADQVGIDTLLKRDVFEQYSEGHPNSNLNYLKWKKLVRTDIEKFYTEEVSPLVTKG